MVAALVDTLQNYWTQQSMYKVFSTELNPENSPQKPPSRRLSTLQTTLQTNKQQTLTYIDSIDIKLNTSMLQQLAHLKLKHLELAGTLSGLRAEKTKILKDLEKKQDDWKQCFEGYLMSDIEKFKDHKGFFKGYFLKFSGELKEAVERRDRLGECAAGLRKQLKEIKRGQIRKVAEDLVLPSLGNLRTSKTIRTTEPTERSIRISTDVFEPLSPMSPMLMRMGGSQPILSSRIHQPIKTLSSSNKKGQRKQNIQLLKSLFQQRYRQNKQTTRNNFQKILFQRRNYAILMEFFQTLESN